MKYFYLILFISCTILLSIRAEESDVTPQAENTQQLEQHNAQNKSKKVVEPKQSAALQEILEWENQRNHRFKPFIWSVMYTGIPIVVGGIIGCCTGDATAGAITTLLGACAGYGLSKLRTRAHWNNFIREHPIVEQTETITRPDGSTTTKTYRPPFELIRSQEIFY
jgi:hypothetical protein